MALKKILNKILGYRWSLYVVRNDKELIYAMHEDSVIRIVGYVMGYYKNGSEPIAPWSLYLNFNKNHTSFQLKPDYFTPDGNNVTRELIKKIESIDPDFRVKGAEPFFIDVLNNKRLEIRHKTEHISSLEDIIKNFEEDASKGPTFFSVMDEIFGK